MAILTESGNRLYETRRRKSQSFIINHFLTPAEKEDYFHHFLEKGPSGEINLRMIDIGCNSAADAGVYTFTFSKTGTKVSERDTYT